MKKIYYLSTCNTCDKILKQINLEGIDLVDIKQHNISEKDLDFAASVLGSYEMAFNKRAIKFRTLGLNKMSLKEEDYRKYILDEYTFVKRPLAIIGDSVFAGNSKSVVEALKIKLNE